MIYKYTNVRNYSSWVWIKRKTYLDNGKKFLESRSLIFKVRGEIRQKPGQALRSRMSSRMSLTFLPRIILAVSVNAKVQWDPSLERIDLMWCLRNSLSEWNVYVFNASVQVCNGSSLIRDLDTQRITKFSSGINSFCPKLRNDRKWKGNEQHDPDCK